MYKVIYQDSNDEFTAALRRSGDQMNTLIDLDCGVKSAASNAITKDILEQCRPTDSNHFLVHCIAMGDSDMFGPNRNGDYFSGAMLEKRANTFVTNALPYREHRNNDPKKALGRVKYAAYDKKHMHRVELLIEYDRDKAEEEYQLAKDGTALNFSMSCRVPHDRCSCCGNMAKKASLYCDCLKNHMGQYMDGFNKYAFAYNDDGVFVDISRVNIPADRIARHLEYVFNEDGSTKSASYNPVIGGATLAELAGYNDSVPSISAQLVISKLAESERYIKECDPSTWYTDKRASAVKNAYPYALMERLDEAELEACRSVKPETLFREMAKKACILSFPAFCQYMSGHIDADKTAMCKQACTMLPSVFSDMMRMLPSMMAPMMGDFEAGSNIICSNDCKKDDFVDRFMDKMEAKFSTQSEPTSRRVMQIIIRLTPGDNVTVKQASAQDITRAKSLAHAYGQYQAQAICDIRDMHGTDFVDSYMYDFVTGANSSLKLDR